MLISEFSRSTGLKQATIRFYIGMGLLNPQRVPAGGSTYHQHFSDEDIRAVDLIGLLQSVGCSLNEIASMSNERRSQSTGPARLAEIVNFQIKLFEEKQRKIETAMLMLRQELEGQGDERLPEKPTT